jgi:hypothetical protein
LHEHGGKLNLEQIDAALTSARVFTMESKQLQFLTLYEQRPPCSNGFNPRSFLRMTRFAPQPPTSPATNPENSKPTLHK